MLAVLIIGAAMTALGVLIMVGLGRGRRFNEVDRFHRARAMTTEWARRGVTTPVIAEDSVENGDPATRGGHA